MKKIVVFTLLMGVLSTCLTAQAYDWSEQVGGPGQDNAKRLMTNDDGSLIVCGLFYDSIDADPGPGVNMLRNRGNAGIFIQKINAQGNLVWARQITGSNYAVTGEICKDPSGNIIITGQFKDSIDFDPGPGDHTLRSYYNGTYGSGFILKLDADGLFKWVATIDGGDVGCNGIVADPNGNIYVGGGFIGYVDFNPGPATFFMNANHGVTGGGGDAFILKLDADGNFSWAKRWGDIRQDIVKSVDLDQNGNIISTGVFMSIVDFDPGPGTTSISAAGYDNFDVFIHKLSPSGDFIWVKAIRGTDTEFATDLKVDLNDNIIASGYFNGTADFDPGPDTLLIAAGFKDAYLMKLDANGSLLWVRTIGNFSNVEIRSLDVDELGDIYTTGLFEGTVDFDAGPGEMVLTTAPSLSTAFVFKTDFLGNPVWATQTEGYNVGQAIKLAQNGNMYVGGYFKDMITVNPGPGQTTYQSNGNEDAFVLKTNQDWNFYGTVFNDVNQNGIQDNGEPVLPGIPVVTTPTGYVTTTNNQGIFHFYANLLGDTVSAAAPWPGWQYAPAFAVPDSAQSALNFAAQGPEVLDVAVTAIETTHFRPGFATNVEIQVSNNGTLPVTSVPLLLTFSGQTVPEPIQYISATQTPVFQSQDTIKWEIAGLQPGKSQKIRLKLWTPTSVLPGTDLAFSVEGVLSNDAYPANNISLVQATVVASFDPNEKQVTPDAVALQALDTTDLRYVIRFQNTGNYPADFVVVRDTLPDALDLSTLKVIAASHPNTHRLYGPHVLEFRFDPIHLPDSTTNEPESHGFVAFTVQANKDLPLGTIIHNRAGIYFDYNPPVITAFADMHVGTSVATTAPGTHRSIEFSLRPNPVAAHCQVAVTLAEAVPARARVTVLDVSGKVVQEISLPGHDKQFYLNGLPAGSYFVQVRAGQFMSGNILIVE